METNLPEDQPSTEPPLETPPAPVPESADALPGDAEAPEAAPEHEPTAAAPPDELTQLAEASQRARLAPAQEERMTELLKDALLSGRAGVTRAVDALPKVPWIVGVRAIEQVWPELSAGFRTQLLAGLGKDETDAARRMRLSVARALFKVDAPVTLKVAVAVAKEMRDKDSGALAPKHAQIFSNVFIGRAKPWVAQLALAELKPAEADALVHCAVLSVFTLPHPPVTQLGILKWTQENGLLGKLHPEALEAVKKAVVRWSGRWQAALRKEVAELPEEIAAVLKPVGAEPEGRDEAAGNGAEDREGSNAELGETGDAPDEGREEGEGDEPRAPKKERPVYVPRPQKPGAEAEPRRDAPRERPVYEPRNGGGGGGGGSSGGRFDLATTLRQIEQHVQTLRSELAAAKARPREERPRRAEKAGPIIEGAPTPDELARLNLQLEARNAELQSQIAELTQHSEDLATSTGAMSGEPVTDTGAQLRTLLALKLQENYADFLALEKESNDLVVRQHFKGLIGHIFEVLQQLDVPLKADLESV